MIFIDTGAWVARFSRRDQYHAEATRLWAYLQSTHHRIYTSDAVLFETLSLLARRLGPQSATQAGRFLLGWSALQIIRSERQDQLAALGLLDKYADQEIGFVDCLSFALMRRTHISAAFTFDRHFEQAGFSVLKRD